jgi:hypothetical protein
MLTIVKSAVLIIFACLLSWTDPANAYTISPRLAIHEAMTALAENCLESYEGNEPYDCSGYYPEHLRYFAHLDYDNPVYNLSVASRWADDPQRMLRGLGYLRFGLVFLSCESRLERNVGVDGGGLLCTSHFGPLLFFQAMASTPDESTEQTTELMLQWTALTYGLAVGDIDHQQNYCAYFEDRADALAAMMLHADFRFCGDRTAGQAPGKWTLGTPFLLRCASLFSPCRETYGDAARREVRVTAIAGLLHMVQDSFSQAHTQRGPVAAEGTEARIVCLPVTEFYGADTHDGDGDRLPIFDRASCGDPATRSVDDPITAAARLLWMLEQDRPISEAVAYVERCVIGTTGPCRTSAGA